MLNANYRCVLCNDTGAVYSYIDGKTISKPCKCVAGDGVRIRKAKRNQQEAYYHRVQEKKTPLDI